MKPDVRRVLPLTEQNIALFHAVERIAPTAVVNLGVETLVGLLKIEGKFLNIGL